LLTDFQDRNQEALDEMKRSKESYDQENSLLKANIEHLEVLRDNLEKSVSEKTEVVYACKKEITDIKEVLSGFKAKNEEIVKNNLRLKGNLEVRVSEVANLKEEISKKSEEVATEKELNERLISEQKLVKDEVAQLNEQKVELERLRTAELEMCVRLREQLDQMKTAAEEEEAQYHKEQHQLLQDMIEPFKEQLESFEMEKRALMTQSEAAQGEVKKLATQYGSLLGHQNHQQKIQHVVKIKKENVDLKAEVTTLKEQLAKAKRAYARMEEKHNEALGVKRFDPRLSFQPQPSRNKENLVGGTPVGSKGVFQTPQGPVPGSKASRHSTGSPLSRVNRH